MSNVRFVSRPGGIIVHYEDGRAEALPYNSQLDVDGVISHQREAAIAATSERPNSAHGDPAEIESARRAALADAEATALPSNYDQLDEEGAVVLMVNVTSVAKQAALLDLEVRTKGGRQRVMDAASGAARALFEMSQGERERKAARLAAAVEQQEAPGAPEPGSESSTGDPTPPVVIPPLPPTPEPTLEPPGGESGTGEGEAALADPDHPAGENPPPPTGGDAPPSGRRRRTPPTE